MLKILKWSYRLGVMAERRRIKLFIAEHRQLKPQKPDTEDSMFDREVYHQNLNTWFSVETELGRLLEPDYSRTIHESRPAPLPIEESV